MDNAWEPHIVSKVALTSVDWEVLGRNIWVDKKKQLVYFLGLRESPLEKHLYVVSLTQPNHIRLLTKSGNSYSVEFNDDCSIVVQTFCNIHQLPTCGVYQIGDTNEMHTDSIENIELRLLGYLFEGGIPNSVQMQKFSPSIYSRHLSSGELLYAMVFKPHNFRPGQRYPTVLNVYGGPEVQTVNNTFKGMRQLRMHMLAAQGYCVVCIDSRGSRHRGVEFESHLWRRMGSVELADQVEILTILANDLGFIDMDRIAIHTFINLHHSFHIGAIFALLLSGEVLQNTEGYATTFFIIGATGIIWNILFILQAECQPIQMEPVDLSVKRPKQPYDNGQLNVSQLNAVLGSFLADLMLNKQLNQQQTKLNNQQVNQSNNQCKQIRPTIVRKEEPIYNSVNHTNLEISSSSSSQAMSRNTPKPNSNNNNNEASTAFSQFKPDLNQLAFLSNLLNCTSGSNESCKESNNNSINVKNRNKIEIRPQRFQNDSIKSTNGIESLGRIKQEKSKWLDI